MCHASYHPLHQYCYHTAAWEQTHVSHAPQSKQAQTLTSVASYCKATLLKYEGWNQPYFDTDLHTSTNTQMSALYNILPAPHPLLQRIHNGSSGRKIKRALSPDSRSTAAVIVPEPVNDQHLFPTLLALTELPLNKAFVQSFPQVSPCRNIADCGQNLI